ncbi:MAG: chromatin segregation and condensation protein Rec8/ScpA/Scc1 (kleisin family) [Candidatus Nanohaloarchaea archaeon]|jgi:chromatin segregation and condensation protein Rec8/ScpA/Scc1 (kleisin family)
MQDFEPQEVNHLNWEETLEFLTQDMPAEEIDIAVLADRYREYIQEMEKYDLKVPAKAIRICSALLNMKTAVLLMDEDQREESVEEVEEELEAEIEGEEEEDSTVEIEDPPELDIPVKQKPKRRVHLNELKDSLRDAMQVKEQREQRVERREQIDEQFEMDEDDLESKLNNLLSSIKGLVSSKTRRKIDFNNLIEQNDNEEKIEKFKHILHLENDEKVDIIQEEFLGDLEVKPDEEAAS